MDLILSTNDFQILGQKYPGFPILVDRDMRLVVPAHHYLIHRLIHRGRVSSKKSWATIGQHLYDYFGFLEANRLNWQEVASNNVFSPVSAYRNWAIEIGNSPNTINQRLGTVVSFYEFAKIQNWIDELPFSYDKVVARRTAGALSHIRGKDQELLRPDVQLLRKPKSIEFLSSTQIRQLLAAVSNPTHRLMVRMGLQVGLRREEIATFPLSYVFDPTARGRTERQIRIELNPKDMALKGNRPRHIYLSNDLMKDLFYYAIYQRHELAAKSKTNCRVLFLSDRGERWAQEGRGFLKVLTDVGKKIGFHVYPHLLRHTYATHTLHALLQGRDRIDPLVFLQRQLGHSSIETTSIYMHLVNSLAESAVMTYDAEVTKLSRATENA